jgi:DNA-binding SARP family transcriptional activator
LGGELDPEILAWSQTSLDPAKVERSFRWDIRTLAETRVVQNGKPIPERSWRGATTRRLLLRLHAAEGSERREVLQLDLWPDSEPSRAAANLRVALSRLRSALGPDAFQSDGDRVVLDPELFKGWDVARLKDCDAVAGVELYRGSFAPELYDDWAEDLRREIEMRFLTVVRNESKQLLASSPQAALVVATRLTEIVPLDEDAWILRVRAEQASGDPQSARHSLVRGRELLEREFGSGSGAQLRSLERELDES